MRLLTPVSSLQHCLDGNSGDDVALGPADMSSSIYTAYVHVQRARKFIESY